MKPLARCFHLDGRAVCVSAVEVLRKEIPAVWGSDLELNRCGVSPIGGIKRKASFEHCARFNENSRDQYALIFDRGFEVEIGGTFVVLGSPAWCGRERFELRRRCVTDVAFSVIVPRNCDAHLGIALRRNPHSMTGEFLEMCIGSETGLYGN